MPDSGAVLGCDADWQNYCIVGSVPALYLGYINLIIQYSIGLPTTINADTLRTNIHNKGRQTISAGYWGRLEPSIELIIVHEAVQIVGDASGTIK